MSQLLRIVFVAVILVGSSLIILSSPLEGKPCAVKCPTGEDVEFCPGDFERFECCAKFCLEPTCLRSNTSEVACKRCPIGCFCRKGYIRSFSGGPCVKQSDCKQIIQELEQEVEELEGDEE